MGIIKSENMQKLNEFVMLRFKPFEKLNIAFLRINFWVKLNLNV